MVSPIQLAASRLTRAEATGSPIANADPSPRMLNLFQLFEQATGIARPSQFPPILRSQTSSYSHTNNGPGAVPLTTSGSSNGYNRHSNPAYISPITSAGSEDSPVGSKASADTGDRRSRPPGGATSDHQKSNDIMEIPRDGQSMFPGSHGNGDGISMFDDSPSWLTEGMTAPINMYHRKSSDGATLRLVVEALAGQTEPKTNVGRDTQDPLDISPPQASVSHQLHKPIIQQSPFGTLIVPPQTITPDAKSTIRLRRSTTIVPSWSKAPRILVVEDDLVYRQLSSKFLEKFGCITETVEDAQGAIEKMNRTKYDLVLMDIFFGPSMDG
jgi:osomolarity two-component system response regulator SKN7